MTKSTGKRVCLNGDKLKVKHEVVTGAKKRGCVFDTYFDLFFFKQKPIPYAFLQRLAEDLWAWSMKDTSLRIEDFYTDCGIRSEDFYRFIERCEELRESHSATMIRLATRRDKGALTKKFDASWAARTQAAFDSEYRKARQFEASLQKDNEDKVQRVVVLEKMPDVAEVKAIVKDQE